MDTGILGIPGRTEVDLLPVYLDLAAFVGRLVPADDLDQRGFSGAVLPQQSMDLTLANIQVHIPQDVDAEKRLSDISQLQNVFGQSVHLQFCVSYIPRQDGFPYWISTA